VSSFLCIGDIGQTVLEVPYIQEGGRMDAVDIVEYSHDFPILRDTYHALNFVVKPLI